MFVRPVVPWKSQKGCVSLAPNYTRYTQSTRPIMFYNFIVKMSEAIQKVLSIPYDLQQEHKVGWHRK